MTKQFVAKGWGHELIIANSPLYCGKLLHFDAGKRASLHYHRLKTETFYLHSGELKLEYGSGGTGLKTLIMVPGTSFHVPPGMWHRMTAIDTSDLFEFSTEHFDSDSYRIEKGD